MDARVRRAVLAKIDETISNKAEIAKIRKSLNVNSAQSFQDFTLGIAVGRIYNSFHYQTRRILKRSSTEEEFSEFVEILASRADEIREVLSKEQR
ncbi:MAG: hypothetical protein ACREAZ_07925 [Nitrososphaera sp.]